MTIEELQQSVVFAARFDFFAQTFELDGSAHVGSAIAERPDFKLWKPRRDPEQIVRLCSAVLPLDWSDQRKKEYALTKAWCGMASLSWIKQAGLAPGVFWKDGLGFCEVQRMPHVVVPEPGDVAYFDKPFQHHAIVELVNVDPVTRHALTFNSYDGNQPAILHHVGRPLSSATAFYSLRNFIAKALQ